MEDVFWIIEGASSSHISMFLFMLSVMSGALTMLHLLFNSDSSKFYEAVTGILVVMGFFFLIGAITMLFVERIILEDKARSIINSGAYSEIKADKVKDTNDPQGISFAEYENIFNISDVHSADYGNGRDDIFIQPENCTLNFEHHLEDLPFSVVTEERVELTRLPITYSVNKEKRDGVLQITPGKTIDVRSKQVVIAHAKSCHVEITETTVKNNKQQ